MRSTIVARAAVSLSVAIGIVAGGFAVAGVGHAAVPSVTAVATAVDSGGVGTLAVNNLGLSRPPHGYTGKIDGYLGTESWKALQRWLKNDGYYDGRINGVVSAGTIKALQRYLKEYHGYKGKIDGIAGSGTRAAFERMAISM
jgi:peptidoglycan hydrolase-like protein with peptidoglycan-binding domain